MVTGADSSGNLRLYAAHGYEADGFDVDEAGVRIAVLRRPVLRPRPAEPGARVVAYVVRDGRLLVFDHADGADAGAQVPAGGLHRRESVAAAAVREVAEEAGVVARFVALLGYDDRRTRKSAPDGARRTCWWSLSATCRSAGCTWSPAATTTEGCGSCAAGSPSTPYARPGSPTISMRSWRLSRLTVREGTDSSGSAVVRSHHPLPYRRVAQECALSAVQRALLRHSAGIGRRSVKGRRESAAGGAAGGTGPQAHHAEREQVSHHQRAGDVDEAGDHHLHGTGARLELGDADGRGLQQ